MVDFHTHIIPSVDDGSKNIEETIQMIEEAKNVGFDTIISTSHYIEGYYQSSVQERQYILDEINKRLNQNKIEINLYLGNEVFISNDIIKMLEDGKICTINGTNYLLFELPFSSKPINLLNIVYQMFENKIIPILAHPERYEYFYDDPNYLYDLVQKGVLMQSNYGSFVGQYGKKAEVMARKLLKNNMVHFLGSDVHYVQSIYNKIPNILQDLEKIVSADKIELLTKVNPSVILKNEKISIEEPIPIKWSLKEKFILRSK